MSKYIGAIPEKRFEYKGFQCVVIMQALAFRTGYVGIPKGHELYSIGYGEIDISCHGGLTYSQDSLIGQTDTDMWWIGFDTGHYGDGKDYASAFELFKDYPETIEQLGLIKAMDERIVITDTPRSLEYCMNANTL